MKPIILAAAAVLLLTSGSAEARRLQPGGLHPDCNVLWPCVAPERPVRARKAVSHPSGHVRKAPRRASAPRRQVSRSPELSPPARAPERLLPPSGNAPAIPGPGRAVAALVGIVPGLASKVAEIVTTCGSTILSSHRHTYVAGTRRISLHASGRAVDVAGNPSCIYSMLHGWPGGYSVDYGAVRHVHISLGGREDGTRFVHGGRHHGRGHRHRHSRHHR